MRNPNPIPLPISGMNFQLDINDTELGPSSKAGQPLARGVVCLWDFMTLPPGST